MTQLFGQVAGQQQPQFLKAYGNARKLFELRTKPGVGVLTYGAGNIGPRSVGSLIEEYSDRVEANTTVARIAEGLRDHIRPVYQQQFGALPVNQQPAMGFYVAGYSQEGPGGLELEFMLPQGEVTDPRPNGGYGASWRGVPVPFGRLYSGIDGRVYDILAHAGVAQEAIERLRQEANQLASPIAFDGMPVQDAIGFCKFILDTTIGVCTYEVGVPSCGGPLQLAVITKRDGFMWVAKPEYSI
jgi:hypothetical protein